MDKLKYPIGIQDFREVRTGNYVYVDKTQLIHQLISSGKYYFLSRPRRFGKSLLLNTLKEIFSGSKALFEGLWIENHWDWSQSSPVIKISFSNIGHKLLGLEKAIHKTLDEVAVQHGMVFTQVSIDQKFKELIETLAKRDGQVVLLIDEYDKPIIDHLGTNTEKALENRETLKTFYSVLKDADQYLRLVLITGVSKFSRVSIFSDLNNLNDITLHPAYATLVGITAEEIDAYFAVPIAEMEAHNPAVRANLKEWYNGYSWDTLHWVYNPFSLLRFFESGSLQNFWFETGTPTFLVDMIRQAGKFDLNEDDFVSLLSLSSFELSSPNFMAILFQTGYLTFAEVNFPEGWCKLRYPNREVKASLEQLLMDAFQYQQGAGLPAVLQLRQALQRNDLPGMIEVINAVFSAIPYDLWRTATELHYHALVHLMFNLLGNYLRSEVHSARGRCDALVQTTTHIYAFEFKLDESADKALQQILAQHYLAPFQLDPRKKVAIGINFSSAARQVAAYELKEL